MCVWWSEAPCDPVYSPGLRRGSVGVGHGLCFGIVGLLLGPEMRSRAEVVAGTERRRLALRAGLLL
jgi:hypothetical protein